MDDFTAFRKLIEMAEARTKFNRHLTSASDKEEAEACVIGADFIRQMSGCWMPEERSHLLGGGLEERFLSLCQRLNIY